MLKDFFQRNIDLMNQLRSEHFKYTEYLSRGKYKMKQKFFGKGKKHYDFDINSQQYFHQEIQDVSFESSEIQDQFFNLVNSFINKPLNVKNVKKWNQRSQEPQQSLLTYPLSIFNPSQCRTLLAKHFFSRVYNLKYKKYLILSRYFNSQIQKKQQQILPFIQSRTQLIDKQIQISMNRQTRLNEEDYFQQSFTQGGKPIPISQTGQPIYKYLDEEQCWYSNISRDDIIAYTRNIEFKRELLNQFYYPMESQLKAIVLRDGLEILFNVEEQFEKNTINLNKKVTKMADEFNSLVQKQLQLISPGNLVQKQNLNNFGYTIFGVLSNSPVKLPLYPAIYPQLLQVFTRSTNLFFRDLQFKTHQNIIALIPKLNSFCQILFKYQNHEILQGKKEIKLGLEDDIDVRKQLYTMLEQIWVRKYVTLVFQRYDYKLQIKPVDWPLQSITQQIQRQNNRKKVFQKADTSIQQLIRLLTFNDFVSFRRHMKKRAQKIVQRSQLKYFDMENINHFNKKSDQKMTLQQLSQLFKVKFNNQPQKQACLKNNSQNFFNQIMKKYWIINPAQIQIEQTLKCLKIRQDRAKLMNVLNGMRCYHRNLCLDLRVISGQEFKFKLDDAFLINSNKQVVENFQKTIKQTATFFTKNSQENKNGKVNQQFVLPQRYHEQSMLYKKDVVDCKYYTHQRASNQSKTNDIPHVLVSNGKRRKSQVIYGVVIQRDLPLVQKRILQYATKVINQYERYIKIKQKDQIVDRVELLRIFYECELRFLFAKFRLIEKYYYLYENTTSLLDAFKISRLIVELMHKNPVIDFESMENTMTFEDIYDYQIESFKEQEAVLEKMILHLKVQEEKKVQVFHQRYCQLSKVPLSAQIYLYRDIQPKEKSKTRLQRMNSMASKLSSKSSKGPLKGNGFKQNSQIKQQFDQQDSERDNSFDIENYDQYLLKKDMDAIFDDMVQPDDNKDSGPVNTAVQQNIVINPRYEGGPHPYNYSCDSIKITSDKKQNILSFYQTLSFASNIKKIIQNLQLKFISMYGHVSKNYQTCLLKVIGKMMNKILSKPLKSMPKWKQFQSYDPYHQIVTSANKFYEQIMGAALEPPSNIQMAIASTLQKHQQNLPNFSVLSVFDYYSIQSLICLKKPCNIASYRQLALGINFITFLNIRQSLYQIQLKRERIIQSYQKLAINCGSVAQRNGSMYSRSGQSDSFLSIQQIRQYRQQHLAFPVFPQPISELKILIQCQKSDVQLFQTILLSSKIKVQDYIIMKNQIGKNYLNSRFDHNRLLAKDLKTIKMIKNRLGGQISNIFQQQFKRNSFIKVKQQLKLKVQKLTKQILQADISNKIVLPKQKISEFSKNLLEEKFKRKLVLEVIQAYQKDLVDTNSRNIIFVQTDSILRKIRKIINCVPYLRKKFIFAPDDDNLDKKILYDQKKKTQKQLLKFETDFIRDSKVTKPFYIYSRQQLCNQWSSQQTLFRSNNLNEFKIHTIDFTPPKQKEQLFKWLYKIPDYSFNEYQTKAYQHFIGNLCLPFTGKSSMSQFIQNSYESDAPRNKFYGIYSFYQVLLQYLESNLLLVSLQMEDDILESLNFLFLNDKIVFQEAFPLNDQISIHQSLQTLQKKYLKTCFNYKNERQNDKESLKKKMEIKNYAKNKQHWAVYDQVLDFIIAKVQGRGVIRQNFLPLISQIQETFTFNSNNNDIKQRIRLKNQQIQYFFVLSCFEAYLNEQHQTSPTQASFYGYIFPIFKWFLGSGLENYRLTSLKHPANSRFKISQYISEDEREIQRFVLGLSNQKNDNSVKRNTILQRLKSVLLLNNTDIQSQVRELLKNRINFVANKSGNQNDVNKNNLYSGNQNNQNKETTQIILHNFNFLSSGIQIFSSMGEVNRLKIFARMRYFYERSQQFIKLKNYQPKTVEYEETKLNYIKFLLGSKLQSLSTVAFSGKIQFPVNSKLFKEYSTELKQTIEINTFKIFDKFQEYKAENKIQFSKSEVKMLNCTEDAKKDEKLRNVYNLVVRQIIQAKLIKQQFKSRFLLESIKILRNQKLQQLEPKKIINTSLIPRVHLIASYSSPLVIERKTFISQQYKLAFAQAFINRFRNKVSRVDLLSSGYGFVITVPDLQDCVNFMNKLLFTFAEKQFRYRLETNQQYFQIMVEAINQKNKVINQQQQIIKYLQKKVNNIMEAQYLGKVTKLLHQKTVVQDKLRAVQQSTNGMQDRIRKTVEIQYEKKITSLETQNQMLRNKFNEFKQLFVILTKDTAKNNFLNVANTIRDKVGELLNKRIDIKDSFLTSQEQSSKKQSQTKKMKYEDNPKSYSSEINYKEQQNKPTYTSQDLQRCKLGEDIIHDPYYTTKLITKMRLFNIFKLGCKKINFEEVQNKKTSQLKQLHKIQDTVIAQSEREIFIREQLKKTQEQLSKKVAQLERLKQAYELLDNQRTKLKILMTGKDKKIEQKERQAIQNMKKLQQIQKLPTIAVSQSKVQKAQQQKQKPKISQLRKIHKKKSTKIQKSPFLTNVPVQPSVSVYDRFQLSNKDATWRQKCQQLYIENKKLLNQLQKATSGLTTPTRQGYSLNLRQRKKSQSLNIVSQTSSVKKQDQQKRFPNLSFKYNLMKQNVSQF